MLMNFINTFRLFSSNESPILGTTTIRLKNNEQKRKLEEIQMERKVVLITGGAMGQGKAHALKYAQNGFDVVLADMQDPECRRIKNSAYGVEFSAFRE
jgi:ketol-acid reductoisomerase